MAEPGVVFTCDVDWAPEFAIEDTLRFFEALGFQPTYFATHDSPALRSAGVEIGIHPYLSRLVESEHENEIRRLKDLYPAARGNRTHRNYFGYTTPGMLARCGLAYDISVVTWAHRSLVNRHFTGIDTLTYSWEDGLHFDYGLALDPSLLPTAAAGTMVYNVHPVMIYLNADSEERRRRATAGIADLTRAEPSQLLPYVNRSRGIGDVVREFVAERNVSALSSLLGKPGSQTEAHGG